MGVDLHRRMNTKAALEAGEIVVDDILPDHPAQLLPAGEFPAVIPLPLEDAPEALHRPVVNALAHPGHTLRHPSRGQLVAKHSGRILKSPVAVKQRVCIGVGGKGLVQHLMHKGAVVGVPEDKGDDPPVTEVQDGAEVELMHTRTHIIFELRHIRQPLFVGLIRVKLAVQHVFRQILRVRGPPGTAVPGVFDGGANAQTAADA